MRPSSNPPTPHHPIHEPPRGEKPSSIATTHPPSFLARRCSTRLILISVPSSISHRVELYCTFSTSFHYLQTSLLPHRLILDDTTLHAPMPAVFVHPPRCCKFSTSRLLTVKPAPFILSNPLSRPTAPLSIRHRFSTSFMYPSPWLSFAETIPLRDKLVVS